MREQGFRGNCDSQASWGCAPALPNRIREIFLEVRFPITSRRQTKSFSVQQFFKNAAEVWASSPRLRSKFNFWNLFSLLQLHLLKLSNSQFYDCKKTSYKFEQGNGAIAACWQAKAGVEPPFAGRERPVSLREVLLGKPSESGSAELLRCLPLCCSPVVALSELPMNLF